MELNNHILHTTIQTHLTNHKILSDAQHGFRKTRSCDTQLLLALNDFARGLEDKSKTDIIFLDFAKAIDKVSHTKWKLPFRGRITCRHCRQPKLPNFLYSSNTTSWRLMGRANNNDNNVSHQGLLTKANYCGIRGHTFKWIECFLHNRSQQVVIDGHFSIDARITSGVHQGSVLGSLLF